MTLADYLTPEAFEADAVKAFIQDSDLDDVQKASLSTKIDAAARDDALVPVVIEEIEAALGLE